jgi:magnesium-transporting ATPase (P-type)
VKGADDVIFDRLAKAPAPAAPTAGGSGGAVAVATDRQLEAFGAAGLRTLCVAQRSLDAALVRGWEPRVRAAAGLVSGREAALELLAAEVECELELLGCTAIEDRLQVRKKCSEKSTLNNCGEEMHVCTYVCVCVCSR